MPDVQQLTNETSSPESSTHSTPDANTPGVNVQSDDPQARAALLFLEDFVVTQLLRQGRALSHIELSGAAENFSLGRSALRRALENSTRITTQEGHYELSLRLQANSESRADRSRRPLEATLDTLLREIGKPLPLPVIVREAANLRGVLPDNLREACGHILASSRSAVAVAPNTYLHESNLLDTGAPGEEFVIRENNLANDPDFAALSTREYSVGGDALSERATAILNSAARPLSQKLLGFLLFHQNPSAFDARALATALGDRAAFYSFVGGRVTTQSQLLDVRSTAQNWMSSGGGAAHQVDVVAVLRQRLAPGAAIVPGEDEMDEIAKAARGSKSAVSVASLLSDVLEIEPDDPAFIPTLHGLNEALRRNAAWLPSGIGRFLLRESVPAEVGTVPPGLRPIQLSIRDNETHDPLDIEMSDDGLEGDCAEFIHDPQWEDVGEEVEVKMARRTGTEEISSTRYVVTYPHHREGTIKLRRVDEEFFDIEGALSRISVRASDDEGTEELSAWASRDSGLIYGLGQWYGGRTSRSGGVLEFSKTPGRANHFEVGRTRQADALRCRAPCRTRTVARTCRIPVAVRLAANDSGQSFWRRRVANTVG
jgi:hypothetical protein